MTEFYSITLCKPAYWYKSSDAAIDVCGWKQNSVVNRELLHHSW